jgi:hypothetical protein
MRGCLFFCDPGPCPVDGAPHTTCTAPTGSVVLGPLTGTRIGPIVVEVRRPSVLDAPRNPVAETAPFTTREYQRAVHGPSIGRKRR